MEETEAPDRQRMYDLKTSQRKDSSIIITHLTFCGLLSVIIPKATPTCEAREARGGRPTTRGGYQYTQCFSQDPTYCVCVNDFGEIARGMMREGGSLVCDKNGKNIIKAYASKLLVHDNIKFQFQSGSSHHMHVF